MIELTDEELNYASEEDKALFNKIIEGLPTMSGKNGDGLDKFGIPIPYHSGAHILRHFRDTVELVRPKKIVELGFNMGHSAAMLLSLCDARLHSFDISVKDETLDAARILEKKFHPRFTFWLCDTKQLYLTDMDIDLAFIDAGHDEDSVTNDIEVVKRVGVKYLLFDDIYPRFGPGVLPAITKFPELELVKDMNNLRLYYNQY